MPGELLLLILLIALPGTAVCLAIAPSSRQPLRGDELIFLISLTGLALLSWTALTLAEFARFSLPLLGGALLLVTLTAAGWSANRQRSANRGWSTNRDRLAGQPRLADPFSAVIWEPRQLLILLPLGMAFFLSLAPFEYVVGGRDHGVYVNTGVHIAKTGGILVYDDVIRETPPQSRALLLRPEVRLLQSGFPGPWSEGQRLTGLTIRDTAAGVYAPHAFHLYPALIAVFYAVGGIPFALAVTPLLGLLGATAVYLVTRRLFGWPAAWLTLFLLLLNVAQKWYMQYPSAEIMVQLFFWGGVFAVLLLLPRPSRGVALLGGACFGLLHLAKLDTVLIPAGLAIYFGALWLNGRFQPAHRWFLAAYLLLSAQALWHAFTIATIYFLDHAVRDLLPGFLAAPLAAAAAGHPYPGDILRRLLAANWPGFLAAALLAAALGWGIFRLRGRAAPLLARVAGHEQRLQTAVALLTAALLLAVVLANAALDPAVLAGASWSLSLTRLYLTRIGLVAGAAGLIFILYRYRSAGARFLLLAAGANMLPLYLLGAGTAPDHFWVVRRFVPIAFPALITGAAVLIWTLRPRTRRRWPLAVLPLGLLAALALGFWQHTGPMRSAADYAGLTGQLHALAGSFPDDAVLLLETGGPAQRLDLPLWFIFDRPIFTIRSEVKNEPALATAVLPWVENGRSLYWLAADGAAPPAWPGWRATPSHSQLIDTPLVETPADRIPRQIERFRVQLDIYQMQPETAVGPAARLSASNR